MPQEKSLCFSGYSNESRPMKFLIILFTTLSLCSEPWKIDFHHPKVDKSSCSTISGGIAQTDDIYIQAQQITYIGNKSIDAKEDLLIKFKGYFLKADSILYSIPQQTGALTNVSVNYGSWYIQAKKATLNKTDGITLHHATITTSASLPDDWKITMKTLTLSTNYILKSSPMLARAFGIPVCALPSFSLNLKTIRHSPFRYKIGWETGQGPHIRLGAQLLATENFRSYGNILYQVPKGVGAEYTTRYETDRTLFSTQSSYSYRTYYNANDPKTFQPFARFKGIYQHQGPINAHIQYDYLSDFNFTQYFPTKNFSHTKINPTQLTLTSHKNNTFGSFICRGKLNPWESLHQSLPSLTIQSYPDTKYVYFDYDVSLSNDLYSYAHSLKSFVPNFQSRRCALSPKISTCIPIGPALLTPSSQLRFIYYQSNDPLVCLDNQIHLKSSWVAQTTKFQHTFSPFITYTYITKPTLLPEQHPIFTINDGWNALQQCNIGLDNHWKINSYQIESCIQLIGLFDQTTYQNKFPIISGIWTCSSPRNRYHFETQYNFDTHSLNYLLLSGGWTIAPSTALSCDLFYRGTYGFRKSDPDRFILDVSHTLDSLTNSTLSLKQKSMILRFQTNLTPTSLLKLENHTGWDDREGYYTENMLCLEAVVSNSWKCGFNYTHTIRANKISAYIRLIQK